MKISGRYKKLKFKNQKVPKASRALQRPSTLSILSGKTSGVAIVAMVEHKRRLYVATAEAVYVKKGERFYKILGVTCTDLF